MTATSRAEDHNTIENHDHTEELMFDPKPRGEMNSMVMDSMLKTSWKFWLILLAFGGIVLVSLFGVWG